MALTLPKLRDRDRARRATGSSPPPEATYQPPPQLYQLLSDKGQANGYPALGADGKVPASQLPASSGGTADGKVIYGAGAPSSGTGSDGDSYVDTTNNRLYGPKASGAWPGSYITLGGTSVPDATASAKGIVQLAGDLGGSATAPTVPGLAGKVDSSDARLSDQRVPTDGSVTSAKVANALKPSQGAAAGTESLRALGTAAGTAAAGNDSRLSDQRTPTDGSVTDAKVAPGAAIAESKLALASDAAAGTASRRTLGTGATQALPGTHAAATTGVHGLSDTSRTVGACVYSGSSYPARPTGFASVIWIGPTDPGVSAQDNDMWVPTS